MSREVALKALIEVIDKKRPLSHIETKLTPYAQALCFGVLRHYIRLNAISNFMLDKPIKKPYVHLALLMGLYELSILKKPPYAVINETVSLLSPKYTWAKGLVNAILRRYDREHDDIHLIADEQWNTPKWLLEKLQSDYPNDWQAIIKAEDEHPPMSLRVNQRLISRDEYLSKVSASPIPHTQDGIVLNEPMSAQDLPGFDEGLVSVQDGAAQLAAQLLELKPGLRVLDACSAPGGKTCHILETEQKLELCLALDIEPRRVEKIKENLKRLQLNAEVKAADALKPETWWDGAHFDRILLDAPCSAIGIIRRHPDIKLLRTPEEIQTIQNVQQKLLEALWPLLSANGLLVYATCSIMPEENEQQIAAFVGMHSNCEVVHPPRNWGHPTPHGLQILPGENTMDGFFYSVLKKT